MDSTREVRPLTLNNEPIPEANPRRDISKLRSRSEPAVVRLGPNVKRPRLDLRQLHAFVAVAEELHFGRAAARLHLAQSPLSRVIQRLEAATGVALFVRNKRHVSLTPAGEALLEGARELLALTERIEACLALIGTS